MRSDGYRLLSDDTSGCKNDGEWRGCSGRKPLIAQPIQRSNLIVAQPTSRTIWTSVMAHGARITRVYEGASETGGSHHPYHLSNFLVRWISL
jgi:hypothetical protein